mgnify:CR=1 FL=1
MVDWKYKYLKYKKKYKLLKGGMEEETIDEVRVRIIQNSKANDQIFQIKSNNIEKSFLENIKSIKKDNETIKIVTEGKIFYSTNKFNISLYDKNKLFIVILLPKCKTLSSSLQYAPGACQLADQTSKPQVPSSSSKQFEPGVCYVETSEHSETLSNSCLSRKPLILPSVSMSDSIKPELTSFNTTTQEDSVTQCTLMSSIPDESCSGLDNNKIYRKYDYPMISNLDTIIDKDKQFLNKFFKIMTYTHERFHNTNRTMQSTTESLFSLIIIIKVINESNIELNLNFYTSSINGERKSFDKVLTQLNFNRIEKNKLYNEFLDYQINLLIDNGVLQTIKNIVITEYNRDTTNNIYIFNLGSDFVIAKDYKQSGYHKDAGIFFTLVYDNPGISAEVFSAPTTRVFLPRRNIPDSMKIHLEEDINRHKSPNFENRIHHFKIKNKYSRLTLANLFYNHATPYIDNRIINIPINDDIGNLLDKLFKKFTNLYLPKQLELNHILEHADSSDLYTIKSDDNNIWLNVEQIIKDNIIKHNDKINCLELYNDLIKPIIDLIYVLFSDDSNLELYNELFMLHLEPQKSHIFFDLLQYIVDVYIKICKYGAAPVTYKFTRTLSDYSKEQLEEIKSTVYRERRNFIRFHLHYVEKMNSNPSNIKDFLFDKDFINYEEIDLEISKDLKWDGDIIPMIKNRNDESGDFETEEL